MSLKHKITHFGTCTACLELCHKMKSSFMVSSKNRTLGKDTFTMPDNVVPHADKCSYDIMYI